MHFSYKFFTFALAWQNHLKFFLNLPSGFKPEVYLKLNPDIAESGIDPVRHYFNHGIHEGRSFSSLKKKQDVLKT